MGFVVGLPVDTVVAGSAARLCVVESVVATCVSEAGFDPGKAPKY
jgi:hypothetical protein